MLNLLILLLLLSIIAFVTIKIWVPLLYPQIENMLEKLGNKKLLAKFYLFIISNRPDHYDSKKIISALTSFADNGVMEYDHLAHALKKIPDNSSCFKTASLLLASSYENLEEFEEEKNVRVILLDIDKNNSKNIERLIELTHYLNDNKKIDNQIKSFEELNSLLPDRVEVKITLAQLYEKSLKLDKMESLFNEILLYSPDENEIRIKLIILLFQKQEYKKAFKLISKLAQDTEFFKAININGKFEKILKTESSSSEFVKLLTRLINNTDNRDILNFFAELWDKLTDSSPVFFLGGIIYEKLNNLDKAVLFVDSWSKTHPQDYDNAYFLTDLLIRREELGKAFELCKTMLSCFPKKEGEINSCIEKISKKASGDNPIHNSIMELAQNSNRSGDLIKQYEVRLRKSPKNIEILEKLLILYKNIGDSTKVEDMLLKLLKLKPDNMDYLKNLSEFYIEKNKLKQAKKYLRKMADISSEPETLSKLAELYLVENEFNDAVACFKMLIDKNQASIDQYYSIGEAAFLDRQYDLAIKYLEQLCDLAPAYKDFSLNLIGHCWMKQKKFEKAKKSFRSIDFKGETLSLEQKIDILEKIAEEFLLNNMKNDARPLLKRILTMDKEHQKAKALLMKTGSVPPLKSARAASETESQMQKILADRYKDISEISRGGMGIIYKATDKKLNRVVALKILPENLKKDKDILKRFLREAQAAASLNHSNIVQIFDVENSELTYIAMEFIEGKNLREILKQEKRMPVGTVKKIALKTMEALDYAHNKGIIHRDIKPDNIMLTQTGDVKITDFGLAKIEYATSMTQIGVVMGTEWYMSPEQIRGLEADRRSDIYAFGMTLYELLTGRPPFYKGDVGYQHINIEPKSPREKNDAIPEQLDKLILKCIAKKPERRFQNGKVICEILKNL